MRIPVPEQINPGVLQGDRLSMNAPDVSAPWRALASMGDAVSDLGAKIKANRDKMEAYNASLAMERWSNDAAMAYEKNLSEGAPDGSDFPARHDEYLTKSYQAAARSIRNPEDQARFAILVENTRGNHLLKGAEDARQKAEGYVVSTTTQGVAEAMETGKIGTLNQFNDYFESVAFPKLASVIDDPMKVEAESDNIARLMREAYLAKDPSIAIYATAKPEGGIWTGMDDAEWRAAQREAIKRDDERVKAEAKAREEEAVATVRSGYDLVLSGQIDQDWIESNRDFMSAGAYRNFNDATRRMSVDGKTAAMAFVPLYQAALGEADQGAVQDAAFQAFAEGNLSMVDFARVLTRSRQTETVAAESPWVAGVRKSMATRLAPVDGNDRNLYQKRLQGIDVLDDWLAATPGAKPDEVQRKADEIAKRYIADSVSEMRKTLPLPRYANVPRQNMNLETIGVTAQKIGEAFRLGKINSEELIRETAKLRKWASLFDEEAKLATN